MRHLAALAVTFLVLPLARAGDDGLAGNWKATIINDGPQVFWILSLDSKGGKLGGTAESVAKVPPTALQNAKIDGDILRFDLKVENGPTFKFEGRLPKAGGKKILGSFAVGTRTLPALLEATMAKDGFELERDVLIRTPNDPKVFEAVLNLIGQAKAKKVPAKDVEEWIDIALRAADNYGPRLCLEISQKLVDTLVAQKTGPIAVATARKAEKLFGDKVPTDARLRFMGSLVTALDLAGQNDQIKDVEARMEKLETVAYAEYQAKPEDFKIAKYPGRKVKTGRPVLVELFTGAQCPPCVAADLAFDALPKAYGDKDIVLLQYHLHIPQPDALTNADTEGRAAYYGEARIRGTPSTLFNGKVAPGLGGDREEAEDVFLEFRKLTNPLLELPVEAAVQVNVVRRVDKLSIKATVRDLEKPGPKMKLRLALVEDWVRYKGRNGLNYHHNVVRSFPGGLDGVALTKKDAEQAVTIDLEQVRKDLAKYLDQAAKDEPFLDSQRPMRLKNLSVVAFVQNDANFEVVQAVRVPVKDE